MRWHTGCGMAVILALLTTAAAYGKEKDDSAAATKAALDSLLAKLETVAHDADMTTAQKGVVSAAEMAKFNQQYKGKLLSLRLKVQDVVPYGQGHYVTANTPDLEGVQFPTSKFHVKLAPSEVMSVGRDNILVLRGTLAGVMQPRPRLNPFVLEPGSSFTFSLRTNYAYRVCLDGLSFQLESGKPAESAGVAAASSGYASPGYASSGGSSPGVVSPGYASPGYHSSAGSAYGGTGKPFGGGFSHATTGTGTTNGQETRSVDDIKSFFLKGLVAAQRSAAKTDTTTHNSYNTYNRPAGGTGDSTSTASTRRIKHNHVYTAGELIRKFGAPTARKSTMAAETWTYKCKDGVVHVQFTSLGYGPGGHSAALADRLRLEVTSVDSTSGPTVGLR